MIEKTSATAPETISMYEHEEEVYRLERHNKHLVIMLLIVLLALFATNSAWIYSTSLFETVSYSQDGEGINNINTGKQGDILDGAETQNADSEGSKSQRSQDSEE